MLNLQKTENTTFKELNDYVLQVKNELSATAAATCIIHHDRIVNEWYSGVHTESTGSRLVDEESQISRGIGSKDIFRTCHQSCLI